MRNAGRKFVVWVKQDGEWESRGDVKGEREASREAAECRAFGVVAKAMPVGERPAEAKAS